jgi:hypothetical protein
VEDLTQTLEQPPTQPSPAEYEEPTLENGGLGEVIIAPEPTPSAPEKLTRKQLGQLRRQYVTITHGTVKSCEHLARFSKDHDPKNNCIYCWGAYFMTSVDLDLVHAVLTQKGARALTAMKGTKFVRMFHGFLSTKMLPMLAAEVNNPGPVPMDPAIIVGGTFGNSTTGNEVQATSVAE